ncbi:hypothetical protein NA57DRAFT_70270 [Rhizodiscina lignyota]|uniref:RAVE subunit 2/Rogdi n=1 Tax=Rhizodiscina lignyota TaxID=1504668 RepID=A0A9P4IQ68_9PEZI|nr:hypothetical protein NA57DRAFT_70270 [Rhizodiscina lignyota]
MSTEVWPPISAPQLAIEEDATLARELQWLLESLQSTLQSLKSGLEECAALLAPVEPGSTLVLSSHRSENVKGTVTRVGTRVVKGNVQLRLQTLPPPRGAPAFPLVVSSAPQAPTLVLDQIVSVRTLINSCLDIVDVSTWTGDAKNADFISGQLRLLEENIREAKGTLKGGPDIPNPWWEDPLDENIFDPPLPHYLSVNVAVAEAALVVTIRTLSASSPQPSTPETHQSTFVPNFGLRDRLAVALGATRPPTHDEIDQTFTFRGEQVSVKEKVRVESQDPSLMAALAKLSSLERVVKMSRQALAIVMGRDTSDDD